MSWRDREEVLRNAANKLRGTNIYITEDMSKKMREHRHELQKYARQGSHHPKLQGVPSACGHGLG